MGSDVVDVVVGPADVDGIPLALEHLDSECAEGYALEVEKEGGY